MKRFLKHGLALSLLLGLTITVSSQALAGQVNITRGFSGVWDQPDHQSQGFILQISEDDEGGMFAVSYWFTFDYDLSSAWYVGVGPVSGDEIDMILYRADGIAFLESGIEGNPNVEEIGTLLMRFQNCNKGVAIYDTPDTEIGSGEVRIKRLTSLYRQRCSGGISDNTPNDMRPLKLELDLEPVDENSDAEGEATFWERPGRSDLLVEIEDLPDGTYTLEVCAEAVGDIVVDDEEGSLRFRSPESPGKELLDFEPRDCRFDVLDGDTVVLTSGDAVLAPPGRDEDDDDDDDEGYGDDEIEVDLDATGELPGARGTASLEIDDDRTTFKVKIMNVPLGDYDMTVDGEDVGTITTFRPGNGNAPARGELRFSDPTKPGDEPLDFEPRGALIEVFDGDAVILEADFPDS